MKNQIKKIGILVFATITLLSCSKDDQELVLTTNPTNLLPENGKSFSTDEVLSPITFRWTPLVPKPQSVTYRLRVWQLMQGQNGQQAMRENQPKVTKDVENITETVVSGMYTGPCKPPYMCNFIWTIQAIDSNGTPLVTNAGTSNASEFSF